jgi:subtilisin family serine protease
MKTIAAIALTALAFGGIQAAGAGTNGTSLQRYNVVLSGTMTEDGFAAAGNVAAVKALISTAGGAVTFDLSRQIGVFVVEAANPAIVDALRTSPLVDEAAADYRWKALPSQADGIAGAAQVDGTADRSAHGDALEALQWSMQQIRAPEAHMLEFGAPAVEVGILDSGVDGNHVDLRDNVDCAKGRDFIPLGPTGSVGSPLPCVDNQFHGTHVAGIVAAKANGVGVVGVAPNVTIVPVKVCDAEGYCYSSATAAGITYAGDARLEVVNMSFFVDDDEHQASTEVKCDSDPAQRAFKKANERALKYARSKGVTLVAALGNSERDLAKEPKGCAVVPAMSPGVIGVVALGPESELAGYSSFGEGWADVAAPGGNGITGDCTTTVLSSIPLGSGYGCFQGTSMASPHATGVAALIVSRFGKVDNGDVVMSPDAVQDILQKTAIDIGASGYDKCFGYGRVDALRAVKKDTNKKTESTPRC